MSVSVIVPLFNERDNILRLHQQIDAALSPLGVPYEVLLVDDGSNDGSDRVLSEVAQADPHVTVIRLRRNFGQTLALQAGIDASQYDCLVMLDGDLQNDPADIPRLLAALDEGYDLVHGWRKVRRDALLCRRIPSRVANALIARMTGVPFHDLGCTLKALRRNVACELELFGEMHRFIPVLAYRRGARCMELTVNHRPRVHGTTKYGLGRTTRVLLDLVTVFFLVKYLDRPMRLFGKIGFLCAAICVLSIATTVAMKLAYAVDMTGNPLLLQAVLSAMLSVQFFSLGLLSEVAVRTYFGATDRRGYAVREVVRSEWYASRERTRNAA